MVAARVTAFGGMIPIMDDRLLPDSAASHSENAWLYSGALAGIAPFRELYDATLAEIGKVYRIPSSYTNPAYLFDTDQVWLEFENPHTDVIRAPVFGDTFDRYYWVSSTLPPTYNTRARIAAGNAPWKLGIPTPTVAPVVVPSGGVSGTTVARAYVYTWVSAYGEEGAPSPPHLVTGKIDDAWGVTVTAAAPGDLGDVGDDRYLTHVRIYRTITSASGVATYFLVATQVISDVTYNDTLADTAITGNGQLQSALWTPPPSDLQGFVMMPNGIVAAWRSNELWFSEAYRPHAWPVTYVHTVEYPIVGLGVVGQTLIACTVGFPVMATGAVPASISAAKLASFEPCSARGSIISAPEGVYYASPNGLVLVSPGSVQNITKEIISKDRWQQLAGRASFRAARLGTAYYGFGSVVSGVFEPAAFDLDAFTSEDFTGSLNGILVDPFNQRVAFNLLTSGNPIYGVQNDPWSGELFRLEGGKVYWLDQSDPTMLFDPYIWRSKKFQTSVPRSFGAVKIYFEVPAGTPGLPDIRDTELVQDLDDKYAVIRWYADDRHIATHELRKSGELLRLPSNTKYDFLWFEVEGRVRLLSVHIASTSKELRQV